MSETSGGCIYEGTPLKSIGLRISEAGLIEISGPVMASGYLNNEELWNQQYRDGWFTTSDHGVIDDGILKVLGRSDDVYNTGGEKVSLTEVTEILHTAFPHQQWSAVAVDDAQWGQRLVVAVSGADLPSINEINALLSSSLGDIAKAKQLLTFDAMPMIGIGKINRAQIAKRAQEEFNG
jgi:O-succinylbenzoic acid--CoA ligase